MGETDGRLLERFAVASEETAFEELVQRHGRMVYGVCRRILNNQHDTEDAFQATFVVLARSAAGLRKTESVASWLHGIALRVALNARRRAARLRERERQAAEMTATEVEQDRTWQDIKGVLDEELGRMPQKLRAPLVLCYLEEKTSEEAARELGWTDGELRGRLAKGKEVLRKRLSGKGVALGASVLFALVSEKVSAATVPQACIASTVKAASAVAAGKALAAGALSAKAASLAAETMKALLWAKIKATTAAVALGATVLCGSGLALKQAVTSGGGRPAAPQVEALRTVAVPVPPAETPGAGPGPERGTAPAEHNETRPGDLVPTPVVEAPAQVDELPEAAMESLKRSFPGAVIVRVDTEEEDGLTVYEVELDVGGREYDVEITPDGKVVKMEEGIDAGALPQAVRAAISGLHPDAVIEEAVRATEGNATRYETDLTSDGRKFRMIVGPDGEVFEDEEEGGAETGVDARPPDGVGHEMF